MIYIVDNYRVLLNQSVGKVMFFMQFLQIVENTTGYLSSLKVKALAKASLSCLFSILC